MEVIASIYGGINPWWFLSLGVLLVILDLAALDSEYLAVFGLSIFLAGLFNFLNIDNAYKVWFFPAFLILSYYLNDKIYSKLTHFKEPYANIDSNIIGSYGKLEVIKSEIDDGSEFYSYKEKIPQEEYVSTQKKVNQIYKFRKSNGEIYPAKISNAESHEDFNNGDDVVASDFINGTVIISRRK